MTRLAFDYEICLSNFHFNLLVQPAFHSKLINYRTEICEFSESSLQYRNPTQNRVFSKLRTQISWKETKAECNIGLMQTAVSQLL